MKYNFIEITEPHQHSALEVLKKTYTTINEITIVRALKNQYRLFGLLRAAELVGVVGVHCYPHLTDKKRAWVHDIITVEGEESLVFKSELLARLQSFCFATECPEVAVHAPKDDIDSNEFYASVGWRHFACVFEWTKCSWSSIQSHVKKVNTNYDFKKLKFPEEIEEALDLLRHFHPNISLNGLNHAMEDGYQVFCLWMGGKLRSIATLIYYPHLVDEYRVWLQDGVTLPTKGYKEAACKLLTCVLNECFENGCSKVTVHAQVRNQRVHKFYEEYGGVYTANAYKWKYT